MAGCQAKGKSLTVKDVFFAQVDPQGELYIDQYSDNVQLNKVQDSNQAVLTLLEQCTTELQNSHLVPVSNKENSYMSNAHKA